MSFWGHKTILVTGVAGFLGSFVVKKLVKERGKKPQKVIIPRSRDCDLRVCENCIRVTKGVDIVIHLAARVGGLVLIRRTRQAFSMKTP